jgi:tRNA dimethylallyltransferase
MRPIGPIYLAGPTAVGKSELAVALAERLNGEIIGADAFQVYRGLDILTAKPNRETLSRIPHHLIGEISLAETFDVARYRTLAIDRINDIARRARTPIVVGGTGLYIRSLTHGLAELPPPGETLRSDLAQQPLEELLSRLERLDPVAFQQVDRRNPRRVIRALEVCLLTGRPFSSFREQWSQSPEVRAVLLNRDREKLYSRIDLRTLDMFAAGVVDEVKAVGEIGPTASQAIGFREIRELLAGRMTQSECIAQIQQQTRNYAKRQLTWFRKEPAFQMIELSNHESFEAVLNRLVTALSPSSENF